MIIKKIGENKAIDFAADELKYYLEKMDTSLNIQIVSQTDKDCICVGMCECFDSLLPKVEDKSIDDAIHIDVTGKKGVITGTNPHSVLIAVYRYLKELGVAFIRPGRDNEVIPKIKSDEFVFIAFLVLSPRLTAPSGRGRHRSRSVSRHQEWRS